MQRHIAAFSLLLVPLSLSCRKPAPAPEKPRTVRTIRVAPVDGRQILVQTGEIQPRRETDLSFSIEGRLARRLVDVGAVVSTGQPLAILDDSFVQNEANAVQADLASATSSLELAKASLARQEKLFAGQSASQQQMDESRASVRAAGARRDAASAALLNARKRLGYANLVAPEPGVITAVGANQGQFVAPGIMVVRVATSEREAVFSVSERIVSTAPEDVKVEVRLVSSPDVVVTGTVREVSPTADPVTRSYRVRVALPDPPAGMNFGAPVTGSVALPQGRLVAVPASAITSEGGSPAVLIVDPTSKKLQRRAVSVARLGADEALIASGLETGDLVVTAGVSKLRPQQIVELGAVDGGVP
jgi:RND family efflux transporter MFP subunit